MDTQKQRDIIRLWNRMRRVEGPLAEEIRIQILQAFADDGNAKRAGGSRQVQNRAPAHSGLSAAQ